MSGLQNASVRAAGHTAGSGRLAVPPAGEFAGRVAQVSNLLYRRLPVGTVSQSPSRSSLRGLCGLEICATADWKSALRPTASASAGWVAQVSNLLYRRLPVGTVSQSPSRSSLRGLCGLEIRATADWKSALPPGAVAPMENLRGGITRARAAIVGLALLALLSPALAQPPPLRLENAHLLVEVNPTNGAITRICDKPRGLELLAEPRLADNFRFTLPLRRDHAWQSTEANYVLGREQRLTAYRLADGQLTLEWGAPLRSVLGKRYPVSATMTLALVEAELRFTFKIRNRSRLEIGEVFYPILGGLLGLGDTPEARRATELLLPEPTALRTERIFQSFANMSWLGIFGPEQFYSYPDKLAMPWLVLTQPALRRGVYLGAHDPVARYKVIHLEMSPGVAPARGDGNWPRPEELAGAPAGVKACFVHLPYQPAGRDFEAAPVVLRFHEGDWRDAARRYGAWLAEQQDLTLPRGDWLYREAAAQQCDAVPFRDLPRWAKAAADAGVRALVLSRWSTAGQGSAVPRFEPDPRLGTRAEFADALRQCHALGVKVAVVMNLPPVSDLTEEFRRELHAWTCRDRWGIAYTALGWHEGSPLTGNFGAGERRPRLNPAHPGLRRALVHQIRELASVGVDGVQLQEFFGTPLDFNPGLGRTPDRASWEGGLECLREMQAAGRAVQPHFALSTDVAWDRVLAVTQVSTVEARDSCALRVAVPTWQSSFTVADDDAFNAINHALRYRGHLRIAPAGGQPLGGPATAGIVGYLRTVLAVRELLHHTLRDGEVVDAGAARLASTAAVSVFRHPASGLRTAVLVNPRSAPLPVEFDGFEPVSGRAVWRWSPSQTPTRVSLPARFEIPGRHVALLTEEASAERLPVLPALPAPSRHQQVVFDLAASEDLAGWTLAGAAFSVSAHPGLFTRPTLNSLVAAGETATGTALSPVFTIEPEFDHAEVLWHGGWSERVNDRENLALQFVDAANSEVLLEILPPGTHVLRTQRVALDRLKGRTVRVKLVDDNRNAGFAWLGLRRLALVGPPGPAPGVQ